MMDTLRPHPPEPTPVARQTQAEASEEATDSKAAATTSEARIRPIQPSREHTNATSLPAHFVDCVDRSPSGNASPLPSQPIAARGTFMTSFGRALAGACAAASLLIGSIGLAHAAGALAIGQCGAY